MFTLSNVRQSLVHLLDAQYNPPQATPRAAGAEATTTQPARLPIVSPSWPRIFTQDAIETFPIRRISESNMVIIGRGPIGSKADELLKKTPLLRSLGFRVPVRFVLAEDFFNDLFKISSLGDSLREAHHPKGELDLKILGARFTAEQIQLLRSLLSSFSPDAPIVIRSSAVGDARGTGIYESFFTDPGIESVMQALRLVLRSYFSESACLFRRDAATGEGLGIIIEPAIGRKYDGVFAPCLSGFGYTSTPRGKGYVVLVPGLGGGVESRDGDFISRETLAAFQQSPRGLLLKASLALPPKEDYLRDNALQLSPLFDRIDALEETLGRPQYFEFAMTIISWFI